MINEIQVLEYFLFRRFYNNIKSSKWYNTFTHVDIDVFKKTYKTNSLTSYLECDVYNWPKRVNTKILIILHVAIWFLCAKYLFYAYYYKRYLIGFKGLLNFQLFNICMSIFYIHIYRYLHIYKFLYKRKTGFCF